MNQLMPNTILLSCLLVGCSTHPSKPASATASALVHQKYEQLHSDYIAATANHIAHWPSDHDCDGALWAGEAAAACYGSMNATRIA